MMQDDERRKDEVESFLSELERKRSPSDREIQERAANLFNQYCKLLHHLKDSPLEVEDVFPVDPRIIISNILQVSYSEPHEIPADAYAEVASEETLKSRAEIAGLIDRDKQHIIIAKKFKAEWRRYTAAHEIGHWLLHPDVIHLRERAARSVPAPAPPWGRNVYLRERPVTGHELAYHKRAPEERQADIFGAELLMPTRHLVKTFFKRFGGPICLSKPSGDTEFWLPFSGELDFRSDSSAKQKMRARSKLVANVTYFRGALFPSLAERYGVSPTAMAIQLEKLRLVT